MRIQSLVGGIAAALIGATPVASMAKDYQCAVSDPTGDPSDSPGVGFDGEPYQDMVKTSIERTAAAVVFSMEVAADIPTVPLLRVPNGQLLWMWGMNTGATVPLGYPISPGLSGLLEFWVHVGWDGHQFYAQVIDRRPTLQGGVPLVTSVPFTIAGKTLTVTASPTLFDDPSEFRWGSTTWIWSSHLGTAGGHAIDRAPDSHVTTCVAD